jgi:hypothetical protein
MSGDAYQRVLAANPAFAAATVRFMMLYDAAEVLGELKPCNYLAAAAYLREVADHLMRDAGVPGELLRVMIAARPPAADLSGKAAHADG